MFILLYGCTTWALTKCTEKKLDSNYTRMLRAILNKSLKQHPTKLQMYDHIPPITKTIEFRWTRHVGHCVRSRDELIRDVFLWASSQGWAKAGRPAKTYIQQLCADTGCSSEDLLEAMDDRDGWRERAGISVPMVWHDDDDDVSKETLWKCESCPIFRTAVLKRRSEDSIGIRSRFAEFIRTVATPFSSSKAQVRIYIINWVHYRDSENAWQSHGRED